MEKSFYLKGALWYMKIILVGFEDFPIIIAWKFINDLNSLILYFFANLH